MKKKFGQNFLTDESVAEIIIAESHISNKSYVLEIGPGDGILTKKIISKNPKKFISIEIDEELKNNLNRFFNNNNHKLINRNALNFDLQNNFEKDIIIVSNLPYNISIPLLTKWIHELKTGIKFKRLILMFQKEVAERLLSKENSKKFSRITLLVSDFFKVKRIINVDIKKFFPIPKVDSTVLVFEPLEKYKINVNKINKFEDLTKKLFLNKRKKLKKKLENILDANIIKKNHLDDYYDLRVENLKKDIFYNIFNQIY